MDESLVNIPCLYYFLKLLLYYEKSNRHKIVSGGIFLWNICEMGEIHWMRRSVFDKAYTNELTRQMCFGWTLSFNWLINSFSSWANAKSFFSILYYVSVKLEASFIYTPIIVIVYGSSWRVVFWRIILIAEIDINIWWQYYWN